jgi:hypothetical protein
MHQILSFLCACLLCSSAYAISAELSLSYNYMRRTFDELNWFANQATTAGISFYLGERIAFELSYTNGLYVKKEKESALITSTSQRTTTQYTNSYDSGLIFLFADRRAILQPYTRVGAAYIQRRQEVQIGDDIPFSVSPRNATAPSAGLGLRIVIGEQFGIRMAVDTVQTPVDENSYVYDFTARVGITWML